MSDKVQEKTDFVEEKAPSQSHEVGISTEKTAIPSQTLSEESATSSPIPVSSQPGVPPISPAPAYAPNNAPQPHEYYAKEQQQQPMQPVQPMNSMMAPATPLHALGEMEAWIDCPFCHTRAVTRVTKGDSSMTILLGVLFCLICICAACIPCIAHWCPDVTHWCTNCGKQVAFRPYNGSVQTFTPQNRPGNANSASYTHASAMEAGKPQPAVTRT